MRPVLGFEATVLTPFVAGTRSSDQVVCPWLRRKTFSLVTAISIDCPPPPPSRPPAMPLIEKGIPDVDVHALAPAPLLPLARNTEPLPGAARSVSVVALPPGVTKRPLIAATAGDDGHAVAAPVQGRPPLALAKERVVDVPEGVAMTTVPTSSPANSRLLAVSSAREVMTWPLRCAVPKLSALLLLLTKTPFEVPTNAVSAAALAPKLMITDLTV